MSGQFSGNGYSALSPRFTASSFRKRGAIYPLAQTLHGKLRRVMTDANTDAPGVPEQIIDPIVGRLAQRLDRKIVIQHLDRFPLSGASTLA
jgi:hypothetical protein